MLIGIDVYWESLGEGRNFSLPIKVLLATLTNLEETDLQEEITKFSYICMCGNYTYIWVLATPHTWDIQRQKRKMR